MSLNTLFYSYLIHIIPIISVKIGVKDSLTLVSKCLIIITHKRMKEVILHAKT